MAVAFPGPAPKFAIDFIKSKRLHPEFGSDIAPEEHAIAFMAAKAVEVEVLAAIQSAVTDSLEGGGTLSQFRKELTPRLQELGWWGEKEAEDPASGEKRMAQLGSPWRLKTIWESNLRSARAAGQWDRAMKSRATHPYAVYELGPSAEHRPEHQAWAGTLLPLDHAWWKSHWPPNGWGCKCRVRVVSEAEARRLGGVTDAPAFHGREWTDPRTGVARLVDTGLDPQWAGNPGLDRAEAVAAALARSVDAAADIGDGAVARAAIAGIVESPLLERQLDPPDGVDPGRLPGAYMEPGLRRLMGLQGAQSAADLLPGGPEGGATVEQVRRHLPEAMLRFDAETLRQEGGRFLFDADLGGSAWRVALAVDGDGAAYVAELREQ